jgi:hypothetical protein
MAGWIGLRDETVHRGRTHKQATPHAAKGKTSFCEQKEAKKAFLSWAALAQRPLAQRAKVAIILSRRF